MIWYDYIAVFVICLTVFKGYTVFTRTPEQARLARWQKMTTYDLKEIPRNRIPMRKALEYREVIVELVRSGHARAANHVMTEVDNIIATVEANQRALLKYGFGSNVDMGESRVVMQWRDNTDPSFVALYQDTLSTVAKLEAIIVYIRGISQEGVKASSETAKVQLQVNRQDFESSSQAMTETLNELSTRPL